MTLSSPIAVPASPPRVDVMIVAASAERRAFLHAQLESHPGVRVVHCAAHAKGALQFLENRKPQVVLMDDGTPELDGFELTRQIMETRPLPIVLCATPAEAGDAIFRSLEAGAVACVQKPLAGSPEPELSRAMAHLVQTVRLMAEVRVVKRWSHARGAGARPMPPRPPGHSTPAPRVVGIGASTGGPLVLQTLLAELPRDFSLPLLVVQHIAPGFLRGMADWLGQSTGLTVQIAATGLRPLPGHVYLAPDDFQMGVDASGRIQLTRDPPEAGLRPSVAFLFRSLARVHGPDAIGVLLTGMGKDGAAELREMRDRGATTVVQDSASSVVHGMPGEAIALGGAMHITPAHRMAAMLTALARRPARARRQTS